MRGERTLRVGTSGWLILAALAIFAVVLASARTQEAPAKSPGEMLAAGQSIPITPRALNVHPQSIMSDPAVVDYVIENGAGIPMPSPLGAPAPGPLDPPFGTEVKVHSADPDAQTRPSVAGEPNGNVIYVAYTDQTTPTNRDVFLGRSMDGGATWSRTTVANAAYNEFEPRVVVHGNRVYVFFSHDDLATRNNPRWAVSMNQGSTFSIQTVNFGSGAPFQDLRNPDASSYNGQSLFAVYEATCHAGSPGAAPCFDSPYQIFVTILIDVGGTVIPPSIYFPFAADTSEPTIHANADWTIVAADIDVADPDTGIGGAPGERDVVWLQCPTVPVPNQGSDPNCWGQASITGIFSTDRVRVDASGFAPNFNLAYQLVSATLPDPSIASLYSIDSGVNWVLTLLAGQPGLAFKDPAVFASDPLFHATFYEGGSIWYTYSLDITTPWLAPMRVNSNAGTGVDAFRMNDVTYAGGVRVAWQDTRDGANGDVWYSGTSGYAFYIFDKNPRQGTIDINGALTAVPTAFLWQTGTAQTAACPALEPGATGEQFAFQQWSDGDANPSKSITVGSADVRLICQYTREYFLYMTTSVPGGTVTPPSGWFAASSPVDIECILPPPGATRYSSPMWIGNGSGSFFGDASVIQTIIMNGPIGELCEATLQYRAQIDSNPPGLNIRVDGGSAMPTPQSVYWDPGSTHMVECVSPAPVGTGIRYVFTSWDDSVNTNPRTFSNIQSALSRTCVYALQVQLTVQSNPAACTYTVAGTTYSGTQNLWFNSGSQPQVSTTSPQQITADTRYRFLNWDDGGLQTHQLPALTSPFSLALNCMLQNRYILDTLPSGDPITVDGIVQPNTPVTNWWDDGSAHTARYETVPVSAGVQRSFDRWTDNSIANPRSFTSGSTRGTYVVRSIFEYQYVFSTSPSASVNIVVDGVGCPQPCTFWWKAGTDHTAAFTNLVQTDFRQVFVRWQEDSSTANPRSFVGVSAPATWTVVIQAQYRFAFSTVPSGSAILIDGVSTTTPTGDLWWDVAAARTLEFQTILVGSGERRVFDGWTDGSTTNPRTFTPGTTTPGSYSIEVLTEYELTVSSPYGSTTGAGWKAAGSSATVTLSADTVPGTPGQRQRFLGWTGSASGTALSVSITMNAPKSVTATWRVQYQLTVTSAQGTVNVLTVSPTGDTWYDTGTPVDVQIASSPVPGTAANTRWRFSGWSGAASGTATTATVTMTAASSVTANWVQQVLIRVVTSPDIGVEVTLNVGGQSSALPTAGSYVDVGASYALSVPNEATSAGKTYRFVSWDGANSGSASVPLVLTATYRDVGLFESPVGLGISVAVIIGIIVAILLALLMLRRRRKASPDELPPGTAGAPPRSQMPGAPPPPEAASEAGGVGTMGCPSCGLTIPAVSGPCPVCGAEVIAPTLPPANERIARLEEAYKNGRISKEQYQANMRRLRGNA